MTLKTDTDCLIIGGGIVGMTCALAAAQAGATVTLVDLSAPDEAFANDRDLKFDGRGYAIAASSYNMMIALGVSDHLNGKTGPIDDILISDGEPGCAPSPLTLHFDSRDIADAGIAKPMGYMIEARHLRAALLAQIARTDAITWKAPARVVGHSALSSHAQITLDDGSTLSAKLIIAADGRGSHMRKSAGIAVTGWDYAQRGIVTTVAHARPHNNIAHELFLPGGPFAILPLADDAQGCHRSNIVWTDSARAAKAACALPDDLFAAELARRFGDFLGSVTPITPRRAHPLGLQIAKAYSAPRLCLIGDAAHAIHPIAGQGLNMGLRDVAALADVIADARTAGQDIGAAKALDAYSQWRKFDNHLLASATDIFNRLFSNAIPPVQHLRRLGLGAVDKMPTARKFFMKEAAGMNGELPSLLRR